MDCIIACERFVFPADAYCNFCANIIYELRREHINECIICAKKLRKGYFCSTACLRKLRKQVEGEMVCQRVCSP